MNTSESAIQIDAQKPQIRARSASANSYVPEIPGEAYDNATDVHTASSIAVRLNDQSLDTSSPPSVGSSQGEAQVDIPSPTGEAPGVDMPDASMVDAHQVSPDALMSEVEAPSPDFSDHSDAQSQISMMDPNNWLALDPADEAESQRILAEIQAEFEDEVDMWDTTMVAEYQDEIFEYMSGLELATMPNPNYMDHQDELDWCVYSSSMGSAESNTECSHHRGTRTTLLEWLLQIHLRYHMLPETLWIATNIIDRFLSTRQVSLIKLQLVGITAIFLAAKYEEIMAPRFVKHQYTLVNLMLIEDVVLQRRRICSYYRRRLFKRGDPERRAYHFAGLLLREGAI